MTKFILQNILNMITIVPIIIFILNRDVSWTVCQIMLHRMNPYVRWLMDLKKTKEFAEPEKNARARYTSKNTTNKKNWENNKEADNWNGSHVYGMQHYLAWRSRKLSNLGLMWWLIQVDPCGLHSSWFRVFSGRWFYLSLLFIIWIK